MIFDVTRLDVDDARARWALAKASRLLEIDDVTSVTYDRARARIVVRVDAPKETAMSLRLVVERAVEWMVQS